MFPVVPSNRTPPQSQPQTQAQTRVPAEENAGDDEEDPAPQRREGGRKTKEIPESPSELTSIKDLRKRVVVKEHQGISPALFSVPSYSSDVVT